MLLFGNALAAGIALSATDNPLAFAYQGRVLTADGSGPLLDTVNLKLDIYDPSGSCLLYEETQSGIDLTTSLGLFSVLIGLPTATRTLNVDPGLTIPQIFANSGILLVAQGAHCASAYTPAAGDNRVLRVTVTPLSTGVPTTLTPDLTINAVPYATVADSLQGLTPANLIQAIGSVSQASMQSLTGGGDIGSTFHTHDSLYVKQGSSIGLSPQATLLLGGFTQTQQNTLQVGLGLSSTSSGTIWYNTTNNSVYFWNGTQPVQLALSGSGLGPVTYNNLTGAIGLKGLSSLGSLDQLIGMNSSGNALEYKTLSGTVNQVIVSESVGGITFSAAQNIGVTASPTFSGMTLSSLNSGVGVVRTDTSGVLSTSVLTASDIPAPAGDVKGSYSVMKVTGLQGVPVSSAAPTSGQVLSYSSTGAWIPISLALTLSEVTTGLGYTPLNQAGDTMTGVLNLPADGLVIGGSELVTTGGNVGIGTASPSYTIHVVGTAGLSTGTAWTNASDARLKDIRGDYEYGLNEVLQLHTVRFNYKKDNPLGLPSDHAMTGFIAQEVQQVIPEAVHRNPNGYLELNVDPIHWAVVNAIQELSQELAATKARAEKAEKENAQIKVYLCAKDSQASFCK